MMSGPTYIYLICKSCESFSTETAIVDLFIQRTYFLVSKAKIKRDVKSATDLIQLCIIFQITHFIFS